MLSLLNSPSGFPHNDSHIFLLDFATYYSSVSKRRELEYQIVDEAIVRALQRLPTSPAVITLELPPNSIHWRELFASNGSASAVARQSYVSQAVARLSTHYGTSLLSAIPAIAAGLGANDAARISDVPCLRFAFGMLSYGSEVHPGYCLHTLVADMVVSYFASLLQLHPIRSPKGGRQGSVARASKRSASLHSSDRPMLYLQRCAEANVRAVAQACAQLNIASDALFFTDATQIKHRAPMTGAACARPPPVRIDAADSVPKRAVVKHGVYHAPESCVAMASTLPESWSAMGLACWGWANSSCTPVASSYWVATYETHNDFAWYTCGPVTTAAGTATTHALEYTMQCNVPGFLFVTYLQSYTSNWGLVEVAVEIDRHDAGVSRPLLSRSIIDSRREWPRRSLIETTAVPIHAKGFDGNATRTVRVSLTPLTRRGDRHGRRESQRAPTHSIDESCHSKFKLTALACY